MISDLILECLSFDLFFSDRPGSKSGLVDPDSGTLKSRSVDMRVGFGGRGGTGCGGKDERKGKVGGEEEEGGREKRRKEGMEVVVGRDGAGGW